MTDAINSLRGTKRRLENHSRLRSRLLPLSLSRDQGDALVRDERALTCFKIPPDRAKNLFPVAVWKPVLDATKIYFTAIDRSTRQRTHPDLLALILMRPQRGKYLITRMNRPLFS